MTIDKDSDDMEGKQDQNYVEHVSHLPPTTKP